MISAHLTDTPLGDGLTRRTIGNWLNYRDGASGLWAPSDVAVDDDGGEIVNAESFRWAVRRAPLQSFVGDCETAATTALLAVRLNARRDCWLKLKLLGTGQQAPVVQPELRRVAWANIAAQTDLAFTAGRGRVEKVLRLKAPGHPAAFRFAIDIPDGHTFDASGPGVGVRDSAGVEWLRIPPLWGEDANGTPIRVALSWGANITVNGRTIRTVWVTPNAADLASAVYPVLVDPTTTISGTTAVQDTSLLGGANANNNFGGHPTLYCFNLNMRACLLRVASASIPAGTITAVRLISKRTDVGVGYPVTANIYRVLPANDWAEGASAGGVVTGAPCYNYCKHDTQPWAGSVRCATSGTDYEADATPPTHTSTGSADGWITSALKAAWFTNWRDGVYVNNGITLQPSTADGVTWNVASTEAASNQPYFEVDYTTAPAAAVLAYYRSRRHA